MEYLQSLLLGLIQGLTEFLPVSSSGHLVLMRGLFGIEMTDPLAFDVAVHVATLLAVVVYFRREVWKLFRGLWWIVLSVVRKHRFEPNDPRTSEARLCLYVVLASLPTAVIAFLLKDAVAQRFQEPFPVGIMLLITGIMLFLTRSRQAVRDLGRVGVLDVLLIGLVQGFAVMPGISRSGSTISFSVLRGIERRFAARFSFLIFIPAIVGAAVLKLPALFSGDTTVSLGPLVLGGAVAFVSGFFALGVLIRLLEKQHLSWFAPYCWAVGLFAIVWGLLR